MLTLDVRAGRTAGLLALLLGSLTACVGSPAPVPEPLPTAARALPRVVAGPGEFRGAWVHWQDFRSPAAIERTVARARKAGLNVLLPLANYPHQAMWRSRLIPVYSDLPAGFDPIVELTRSAHGAGLRVVPYLVMLHGGLAKHPNYRADWFAVDRQGQRVDNWLNPAHPEVRQFLRDLVAELAATGVDGIQFDYMRHEYDTDYDYSDPTRQRAFAELGFDPFLLGRAGEGGLGLRLLKTRYHRADGARHFEAARSLTRRAGFAPAAVLEENLGLLRRDTVVIAPNLYADAVQGSTLLALMRHVAAGGAAVILDGPEAVRGSTRFAEAVGLAGSRVIDQPAATVNVADPSHPIVAGLPPSFTARLRGNPCTELRGATPLLTLADGTPLLTLMAHGRGTFVVLGCHAAEADSPAAGYFAAVLSQAIDWLCREQGIQNTTALVPGGVADPAGRWNQWRCDQVTSLAAECAAAARAASPGILVAAAAGCQLEDLTRVKRDGQAWLEAGITDFLCPMSYTRDNDIFRRRLLREQAPLRDPRVARRLYTGIGVYQQQNAARRTIEQIGIAREMGFGGVCFFAFEHISDALIGLLRAGPFAQPAEVPWRVEPAQ